jgi:hypothetical protein
VHGFARTIESEAETLYLSHEEDLSLAAASLDKSNTCCFFVTRDLIEEEPLRHNCILNILWRVCSCYTYPTKSGLPLKDV